MGEPTAFLLPKPDMEKLPFIDRTFVKGKTQGKPAILFLHGFPAYGGKNEDIAQSVSERLGQDAFILHFRGLGKSEGLFSFEGAVSDALQGVNRLSQEGYLCIQLVCHSFGSAIGLKASLASPLIRRLALLAPLLELPDPAGTAELVDYFITEEAKLGHTYDRADLLQDQEAFREGYQPNVIGAQLISRGTKMWVAQGDQDSVVSALATRK